MTDPKPKTLFERMSELARQNPSMALPEPVRPAAPAPKVLTPAEAKAKARAGAAFDYWLKSIKTRDRLDSFDPVSLARSYAPLSIEDVRQEMAARRRSLQ